MYILQTAQRHGCPAFDIGILEDKRFVSNDRLQVGVQEFEHKVHVLLNREDVEQLTLVVYSPTTHRDYIRMMQLL